MTKLILIATFDLWPTLKKININHRFLIYEYGLRGASKFQQPIFYKYIIIHSVKIFRSKYCVKMVLRIHIPYTRTLGFNPLLLITQLSDNVLRGQKLISKVLRVLLSRWENKIIQKFCS